MITRILPYSAMKVLKTLLRIWKKDGNSCHFNNFQNELCSLFIIKYLRPVTLNNLIFLN